jgi:hypothetical protein
VLEDKRPWQRTGARWLDVREPGCEVEAGLLLGEGV